MFLGFLFTVSRFTDQSRIHVVHIMKDDAIQGESLLQNDIICEVEGSISNEIRSRKRSMIASTRCKVSFTDCMISRVPDSLNNVCS